MEKLVNISTLYGLNLTLTQRIKHSTMFYLFVVLGGTVFIMLFVGISLFSNLIEFIDEYEILTMYNYFSFLLVIIDSLCICLRFSARTFIEPYHLNPFPMSTAQKIVSNLRVMVGDYRCIPYLVFTGLIVIDQMLHAHFFDVIVSVLLMLSLYLNITFWMYLLFFSSGSIIAKHRSNAIILYSSLTLFYSVSLLYKQGLLMTIVPLTSYAGTGLFLLSTGDFAKALLFLSLLVLDAIAGFIFLIYTYINR